MTEAPDEQTEVSRRRGGTPAAGGAPAPVRRSSGQDIPAVDPDEGSTVVARRESRRRGARAADALRAAQSGSDMPTAPAPAADLRPGVPMTSASDVPAPITRLAQAPSPGTAHYPARVAEATSAARLPAPDRSPTPVRSPQHPVDTAREDAAARRRHRRWALSVVLAACLVAILAAGALIVVLVTT